MMLDQRELDRLRPPRMIDESRPCRFCGYDLVGIMDDKVCPECGKPIRSAHLATYADQMAEAPVPYLRLLWWGAELMFWGWIGLMTAFIVLGLGLQAVGGWTLALAGGTWFAGVALVARPRPACAATKRNREDEWLWLRLCSWLTQACWVPAGGALVLDASVAASWPMTMAVIAAAIASAGFVPVCVIVSNLGFWAGDTSVSMAMRRLLVFMPLIPWLVVLQLGFTFPAAVPSLTAVLAPIVLLMLLATSVLLCLPILWFTWSMWGFRYDAAWAIQNHIDREGRFERLRERAAEEAQMPVLPGVGVDETMLPGFKLGGADAPPPVAPKLSPGHRSLGMAKKKKPEADPYPLAPEDS